jgi:hypothetical protein
VFQALPLLLLVALAPAPSDARAPPPDPGPSPSPPGAGAEPAPPAEPAPTPPPEIAPEPLPPPAAALGVSAGLSYRLPPSGRDVRPAFGFTLATSGSYRYLLIGERLALSVAAAFAYQRYASSFNSLAPSAGSYTRELSIGDFVVMQGAALLLGPIKPWLAAGGGVSLGHYKSPQNAARPDEERETLLVIQGQLGLDIEVKPQVDLGLRLDLVVPLARPTLLMESGAVVKVFGPRLAARLAFQYRF